MTVVRRSVMTLFSGALDARSHRVRIVLAEKGVTADILNVDPKEPLNDLIDINPYGSIPTLVDRDLVLYEPNIIMEYLDERFPHPPLLPVYPVARAKCRMMVYRIDHDWYLLLDKIINGSGTEAQEAHKDLRTSLLGITPIFADMPYFLNEEFSIVDCCMAPLLWRLPLLQIEIPKTPQTKAMRDYCRRIFQREAFQASLTEAERELSDQHDF